MQQSPPSRHPINQSCGDIIFKQDRSLLAEGIMAVDLDSAARGAGPLFVCVWTAIWTMKVSKGYP